MSLQSILTLYLLLFNLSHGRGSGFVIVELERVCRGIGLWGKVRMSCGRFPLRKESRFVPPMLDWRLLCHRRKKLFKLSLMSSRTLPATRHSPFLLKSLKSLCSSSGTLPRRFQGVDFTEVPDDETTLTFLINLGYKGPLYKHPSIKAASNERLRKSRIHILWGMFYRENVDYPELIWEDFAFQIDQRQLKKGKGSQVKKTADTPEVTVDVFEESGFEPARKQICSKREIKKKVTVFADDKIIPESDVVLELGKSISLTEATKEEAARQFHATHARIVTESVPEPARRRPSGTGGSSEGTGRIPGVSDESTITPKTSSEGTGAKTGVPDKEKVTSKVKADAILDWGSKEEIEYTKEDDDDKNIESVETDEEEENNDDDDDNIDLEKIDDEETDDEFVHSEEHVQDDGEETDDESVHGDEQVNDDEDEEMTNAEDAETGNGDEDITDAAKADAEKAEEVKDDVKKAELPPTSSSLSVSLGFGKQFLNLSSDTSLIGTVKDTTDDEINSLLDVQIQQEIPHIQSYLGDALYKVLQKHTEELIPKYPQQVDYKEMIEESMQANIINEVKNQLPKFLPKAVYDFATPLIQSTTILFDKMDKSRSYLTHDKNQVLFDALFDSLSLDDAIARGEADVEKVLRKRDRDDEDPSAGPKHGKSPAKTSKSGKSVTAEEIVKELFFEMASDDIEQTIYDVANDADQPPNDSTQTKYKDLKKYWFQ
ncbi:hypothetical protein Tco_0752826 [Tanacetum coccineum]|uniref:Uncharacterized protein n=1 Tax=Tanacetum coccineum TaxID=301880 RepID=A0ABQ4Z8Z1_9ASTR